VGFLAVALFIGRFRDFIDRFLKFLGRFSEFIGRFGTFIGQSPKITIFKLGFSLNFIDRHQSQGTKRGRRVPFLSFLTL
jgi:hypothetical protein